MSKKRSIKRFGKVVVSLLLVLCLGLPGQVYGGITDDSSDFKAEGKISGNELNSEDGSESDSDVINDVDKASENDGSDTITNDDAENDICETAEEEVATVTSAATESGYDCVAFARARFREIFGFDLHWPNGNARGYYYNAVSFGDTVSNAPLGGALAVWDDSSGAFGHVGIVEQVNGNNVQISEGGYEGHYNIRWKDNNNMNNTTKDGSIQRFLGYIYVKGSGVGNNINVITDTTPPTISNIQVTGVDKDGYTVTCNVTDNVGVTSVRFPSWNTDIHRGEDANWLTGTISGNTASVRVNISSLKSGTLQGNYMTHIYAYDAAGNVAWAAISTTFIDRTPPVISNVNISDLDKTGYTVTCTVTDNYSAVDRVMFPTWTLKNGQDDLAPNWQTNSIVQGTVTGNQVSFRVNISNHNSERGIYITHIYPFDKHGNLAEYHAPQVTVGAETIIEKAYVESIDKNYVYVIADVDAQAGVRHVRFQMKSLTFSENITCVGRCGPNSNCANEKHSMSLFYGSSVSEKPWVNQPGGWYEIEVTALDQILEPFGKVKKTEKFEIKNYWTEQSIEIGGKVNIRDLVKEIPDFSNAYSIKFYSSDSSIASIDSRGDIIGVKEGKAFLTVYSNDMSVTGSTAPRYFPAIPINVVDTKTITVTLNTNGGDVSTQKKTVTKGSTYGTLPTPTRSGYKFKEWYTAKSGGSKISSATKVNTSKDHTLYAQWAKQYKVTFNANGGSVKTKSKTVAKGYTYGTLPSPTRSKYAFKGWYTKKSGGTKITKDAKVSLTKNQTLYAQWSKVSVSKGKVSTVTNSSSKQAKVTIKKISSVKGYQIEYAINKDFKSSKKTTSTSTSVTLKSLSKGKTYYVRVRGYKLDSKGVEIYGSWSAVKTVEVAK